LNLSKTLAKPYKHLGKSEPKGGKGKRKKKEKKILRNIPSCESA
jgi:hypothetical protein